jgi:hypothetical protein
LLNQGAELDFSFLQRRLHLGGVTRCLLTYQVQSLQLRLLALGGVANDCQYEVARHSACRDPGEGKLDRNLFSGPPRGWQFHGAARVDNGPAPHLLEAGQTGTMPLSEQFRHEDLDRQAHGLGRWDPEEGSCSGVPEHDPASFGVAHDDSVANLPEELAHAEVLGS